MAQLVRSAFNRGGTWQPDALDQGDAARFHRAGQNQDNDLMRQLALAQLQSSDARFGAEREDRAAENAAKYGFMGKQLEQSGDQFTKGLDFQNQALGKQYDFMGQQGKREDERFNKQWGFGQQQYNEGAPLREASLKSQLAMGQLADLDIAERKAQKERAAAAQAGGVPYAARTGEGRMAQEAAAFGGAKLGEQGMAAKQADLPALQRSADIEAQSVLADLGAIEGKAGSIKPWQSIGAPDIAAIQGRLDALEKMYIDAGLSPQDARNKVQTLTRTAMPKSHTILFGENPATALYKHLGMQLPN